jgi:hypothetical protein
MNKSKRIRGTVAQRLVNVMLSACATTVLSGCLVMAAVTDPYNKDLTQVARGTERNDVIAAYGQPKSTSFSDGKEVDTYECDPIGPKPGERAGLVTGMLFLDALTLGVTEIAAASLEPVRMAVNGRASYLLYAVSYTPSGKVESISVSKEKSLWMPAPDSVL